MPRMAGSPIRLEIKSRREMKGSALTDALHEDVKMLCDLMEKDFQVSNQPG